MDEIISYKMCAVKVRNAKLRNYLNSTTTKNIRLIVVLQSQMYELQIDSYAT